MPSEPNGSGAKRPDTAARTVAINHVRAADIAAARDHFANGDGDHPGAERWVEAKTALRAVAVARDASNLWRHVPIAYIVFDLVGRSPDNIYDPAARRARTDVPPWPDDAAGERGAALAFQARRC